MNAKATIISDLAATRGYVIYDGACPLCVRGVGLIGGIFARHGFVWIPIQSPTACKRLGLTHPELLDEMKLLLQNGAIIGGAEAWGTMCRAVLWLWPLGVLLTVPGFKGLANAGYRWLARNRYRCSCRLGLMRKIPRSNRHAAFLELP